MAYVPVAYQLYSAREEAQRDLEGVFAHLHALGYDGVEFAGFYDWSIPEVRRLLDAYGLRGISSHVPLHVIEADMFGTIARHLALGCAYIAVPNLDTAHRPGGHRFSHTLALLHRFGALCREAGITLLFHNHFCEFQRVSGQYGLDFLYDAVPENLLGTQLDVCWIDYAGEDPLAFLRKYAGRIPVVHLKDYVHRPGDISPYEWDDLTAEQQTMQSKFAFCPWGFGGMDARAVYETAIACGAEWFVVEQDDPFEGSALDNCAQSMQTIRQLRRDDKKGSEK